MNQFFKLSTIIGLLVIAAYSSTVVHSKDLEERQSLTSEVKSQTTISGISVTCLENGHLNIKETFKDVEKRDLWRVIMKMVDWNVKVVTKMVKK